MHPNYNYYRRYVFLSLYRLYNFVFVLNRACTHPQHLLYTHSNYSNYLCLNYNCGYGFHRFDIRNSLADWIWYNFQIRAHSIPPLPYHTSPSGSSSPHYHIRTLHSRQACYSHHTDILPMHYIPQILLRSIAR